MESQSETTQTVSALKLPVLKIGDFDLWSMKMEQYLTHTDYALWEVIVNGDAPAIASANAGTKGPIPPKTSKQKLVRKNELKAKSTILLAIPDEHLLKFHGIKDAKTLWEAIKARFRGNKESKKIQKTILKQQYDNFAASRSEGLDKTYDSSTNEVVNTAHEVSTASSQGQASSSTYADGVMFPFFANQSNSPHLDNEDLEQIDTNDLKEMDLKWQVAMLTMRVECYNCHKRGNFARECRAPRNQGNKNGDSLRRVVPVETPTNALVVQDGMGGYDWSFQAKEGITNFSLMAYTSQGSSSSNSEVHTCSKDCLKSYETLQKQYDQQCEALSKSNLEIIGYQMVLESLEARIVVHEKNEVVYEEDIAVLKYDVQVKDISIKDLKNQLEEALKEKDDLKLKLEKFEESSKNLTKLINSQISAKDKAGIGYDSQMNKSEVVYSVFNSRESDVDNSPVNDRFKIGKGFHAVPPPYTGNYMPSRPDLSFAGLDDSVYKTKVSETETSISKTSKDIVEKPKTIRPSAPIIEDWDTDSDNNSVFRPKTNQTKPKFTKINFVKSDENVKSVNKENTHKQVEYPRKSQSPREKPMLNNKGRVTGQREIRPVWNNVQRVNHQNKLTHLHPKRNFVPTAVATKLGQVPVIAAKKAFNQKSAAKTYNLNKKVKTARVNNVTTAGPKAVVSAAVGYGENVVKSSASWIWRPTGNVIDHTSKDSGSYMLKRFDYVDLQGRLKSVMAWIIKKLMVELLHFQEVLKEVKLLEKGKIRTGKLDFEDVYFVKELKFNLFFVSQICDKKNSVLFTETKCLVLSPDFKLLDEGQVLLKVLRQNNMYNFDLKNVVPLGGLICLFAKAIIDESNLWHRRLGHINFKTMNKLVKRNLVRGLPSKLFKNDHTCVACQKGKQHKASCKTKLYETSGILKTFITGIENQINHKDKIIRCDNGTEFKNNDMNQFCGMKRIKREFSVTRTPQQNRVAKRKNRTLIEEARTMLADLLLPTTFWTKAVSIACYVQNRVLVTKPHNKTPCELLHGRPPSISFMRPFGCLVTILNTLDPLGKFDRKADEGFFVRYSINIKAFRSSKDVVTDDAGKKTNEEPTNEGYANNTNRDSTVSPSISATGQSCTNADDLPTDPLMPDLEDTTNLLNTSIFSSAYNDEDVGAEADLNNLETTMNVSPIPTTRIHKDHPKDQIIRDINSATQTSRMTKISKELAMASYIKNQRRTNHKDYQNCLFACFLSQIEPKKVTQALTDPSWIEAMQDELL
ncbi:ribonuclease H-like domain-containing protein [Tanacetum coccineum]